MEKMILSLILFLGLMGGSFVYANNGNLNDASGSVGTSSSLALPFNASRNYLMIENVSATNSLGFTIDGSVAAINGYGTFMLAPGQGWISYTKVPTGAIYVVSNSTSGTNYTIKWN